MSFNNSKFNNAKFNVSSDDISSLRLVTARAISKSTNPLLKRSSILFLKSASGYSNASFALKISLPLKLGKAAIISTGELKMTIRIPLAFKSAGGIFCASKGLYIRTFELVTINLPGLVINPGEVLTIDMDKITVDKNGVDVIEFWQTGSKPFYFVNGENVISYFDSDSKREAEMLIVWRERWL